MWCTISINVLFVERACQKYILMFYDLCNAMREIERQGALLALMFWSMRKKLPFTKFISLSRERERVHFYNSNVLIDERERLLFIRKTNFGGQL